MKLSIFLQKTFTAFLVITILAPAFLFATIPQKAQAQLSVLDIPDWLANFMSLSQQMAQTPIQAATLAEVTVDVIENTYDAAVDAISAAANDWLSFVKEASLDEIAYAIKRELVIKIQRSMINYVAGGFEGDPKFVTSYPKYFGNVDNEITQVFLGEMDSNRLAYAGYSLTDRILEETQARLEMKAYEDYREALLPEKGNEFPGGVNGFELYLEDFNSCETGNGWDCWLTLRDEGNDPFWVYQAEMSELKRRRTEAIVYAEAEIAAANGFRTVKECISSITRNDIEYCKDYLSKIPGQIIVSQLNKVLQSSLDEAHAVHDFNELIAGALVELSTSWMSSGEFGN